MCRATKNSINCDTSKSTAVLKIVQLFIFTDRIAQEILNTDSIRKEYFKIFIIFASNNCYTIYANIFKKFK